MKIVLWLAVCTPAAGAFFLPLFDKISEKFKNITALVLVFSSFVFSALLLPPALAGDPVSIHIALPLGLSFGFQADSLAVFMAMISSFVGSIIVFYSFTYINHYKHKGEYYLMVVLFLGAMMGLVYSTNLIFLYVFWEIAAICCWRLIGFYREKEFIFRANKAFLITAAGALMMLLGFLLIYQETGTFDMTRLRGTHISNTAVLLILAGILSKSATLPFHTWLPDAGVAPSPVTSLLHAAVLVKIGVYAWARLFLVTFAINDIWHTVVPVIAAVSSLVAAAGAIREYDIKRIIAYSTVSQIGFILLGLSTGSVMGAAGGLLYILMHSIAKGGLFLCAGVVEHNAGTKDVRKLGGLWKTMPVTAVSFLLCAFSVMGIPPFGGFFSKFMVIGGAVQSGKPWIAAVFAAGAVLTFIYMLRAFALVFMGEMKTQAREGSRSMVASVAALAALSLAGGLFIFFPSMFVQNIVSQMGGFVQ
ncbi:MAG: NADH-quinone oxidoreductase subunit L [Treponema sp.]|nr:NADH-quinone oxidoreductase subunit L [Treponema sp.]